MVGKKLTARRHFLKSLALGSAFISYWPHHMRMAVASEPANQHFKTAYLFDEEQWYLQDTETYARSIKGIFTDIMIMVYGHHMGGTMGFESSAMPLYISGSNPISKTKLSKVIPIFHKHGIRVHALFNACRSDATRGKYQPRVSGQKPHHGLVDARIVQFQNDIATITADCVKLGVDGINLDFIRNDYTLNGGVSANEKENNEAIQSIVQKVYDRVKSINPACLVSTTTVPYYDITNELMRRSGRKAINWANAGIQDIIFGFEYGIPPNPEIMQFKKIRELVTTDVPYIAMVGNWTRDGAGTTIPQTPDQFTSVLDAVKGEQNICIYHAASLIDEHKELLAARVALDPAS